MVKAPVAPAAPKIEPFTFLRKDRALYDGSRVKDWCVILNETRHKSAIFLPRFKQFNGCGGATLDGFMDFYDAIRMHNIDFSTVWKASMQYLYDETIMGWQMPRAYMLLNLNGYPEAVTWLRANGLVEICTTPNAYHGGNGMSNHVNTLCYWDWTHLAPPGTSYARYGVFVPKIVFKETKAG
jgi:hypothetical protein